MNINNNEEEFRLLTFNTYDRKIEDEDNNDNSNENNEKNMKYKKKASKEFIVQMFGINEQGKTASVFVEDYLPFFYAKVDNKWKEQDKLEFILKIKNDLGDYYDDAIVKSKLIKKKKLYGFDGEQSHSFILIQFKNEAAMKKAKNLWYDSSVSDNGEYKKLLKPDGYYDSVLYEAQIPPL